MPCCRRRQGAGIKVRADTSESAALSLPYHTTADRTFHVRMAATVRGEQLRLQEHRHRQTRGTPVVVVK